MRRSEERDQGQRWRDGREVGEPKLGKRRRKASLVMEMGLSYGEHISFAQIEWAVRE